MYQKIDFGNEVKNSINTEMNIIKAKIYKQHNK